MAGLLLLLLLLVMQLAPQVLQLAVLVVAGVLLGHSPISRLFVRFAADRFFLYYKFGVAPSMSISDPSQMLNLIQTSSLPSDPSSNPWWQGQKCVEHR